MQWQLALELKTSKALRQREQQFCSSSGLDRARSLASSRMHSSALWTPFFSLHVAHQRSTRTCEWHPIIEQEEGVWLYLHDRWSRRSEGLKVSLDIRGFTLQQIVQAVIFVVLYTSVELLRILHMVAFHGASLDAFQKGTNVDRALVHFFCTQTVTMYKQM